MLHHPEIDQHGLVREASLREEAEALRSELEQELDPDQYASSWDKGSGEEVDDVITEILAELEAKDSGKRFNQHMT